MPIMDRRQVEGLLHALGYAPTDEVIDDVVMRLNANWVALRDLDRLGVSHVEPWPFEPPPAQQRGLAQEEAA